jgi:hypothetical protein
MIGGSSPGRGWECFFFTTASRPALGPTQTPIQWAPGALSLKVKRPESEADHSHLHLVLRSRMRGAITHSPNTSSLRGAQLRKKHRDNFTLTFTFTLPWKWLIVQKLLHACNIGVIKI